MGVENNENERYARADVQGGYLYNKSEIDYFKQTQAIDVMYNLMLGDFNKKGAYVINKGIIDQLVKVKKIYQYSFGSTTFCQSAQDIGGYGKIDFAIKMRNNTQNKTITATLQLLETIDRANGYYQNTNTASIAVYTAPESNSYVVDMLKYFNVVSKKEDGLLRTDNKEEDVDLIIARKKYEDLLKNGALGKLDDLNKVLFQKRLRLLSKSEVGKKILAKFNNETYKINGWFLKEGMPGYYRYLNQVLDGLIEVHSAEVLQDVALTAGWRSLNQSHARNVSQALEMSGKLMPDAIMAQQNSQAQKQREQVDEVKKDLQPETPKVNNEKQANVQQTPASPSPKAQQPKVEEKQELKPQQMENVIPKNGGNGRRYTRDEIESLYEQNEKQNQPAIEEVKNMREPVEKKSNEEMTQQL